MACKKCNNIQWAMKEARQHLRESGKSEWYTYATEKNWGENEFD